VPTSGGWVDSINQYSVYNPERLLDVTFDKPELVSEFLFGYLGKKYRTGETVTVEVGIGKFDYVEVFAYDSVFRNLELPSDSQLRLEVSDPSVASVELELGYLKVTKKKLGTLKVKVIYLGSKQSPLAYGEITLRLSGYPLLERYVAEMCDIDGQFRMGRTEVTVAMWREYCEATNQPMPAPPSWGWIDDHPMVNINWYDITGSEQDGFCDWAVRATGKFLLLPTVSQWRLAANGGQDRYYPWSSVGDAGSSTSWDASKCINSRSSTSPVASVPSGNSPFGCADMSGNVSEWTYSLYQDSMGLGSTLTGGSWKDTDPEKFRCFYREQALAVERSDKYGFRLISEG
jgi:hypothetical protein